MSRRTVALVFVGVLVAMLWVTTWASFDRNVVVAAVDIWNDPWGRATLFDAYFGFLAVWLWIAWREPSLGARLGWALALAALGNIAIAVYVLIALRRLPAGSSMDGLFRRRERER